MSSLHQAAQPSSSSSPSAILSQHIQTAALLHSHCYDISLTAFGRLYKLHRILLVQSSFFSTLLQGDFSEGASYVVPDPSSSSSASSSTLQLTFDDPNITRPAFEYCIAHLYGSAPQLVLPHWAIPTPAAPLSSAWPPTTPGPRPSALTTSTTELKAGTREHMPATPRFLLSLLATSVYLGIPSLSSAATTLILASFTPFTISTYLRFALGKPLIGAKEARQRIGTQEQLWDWELEGPCWGLDHIGVPYDEDDGYTDDVTPGDTEDIPHLPTDDDEETEKLTRRDRSTSPQVTRRPNISRTTTDKTATTSVSGGNYTRFPRHIAEPLLDYGQVAHRIAESSFCYLNRWGTDIAAVEQDKWEHDEAVLEDWLLDTYQRQDQGQVAQDAGSVLLSEAIAPYIIARGRVPARVLPAGRASMPPRLKTTSAPPPTPTPQWDIPTPALCIFSHPRLSRTPFAGDSFGTARRHLSTDDDNDTHMFDTSVASSPLASFAHSKTPTTQTSLGLPSNHLVALIASDGFFVRNELQRYQVARGVVMMRRAQKALAMEVEQWLPDEEDGDDDGGIFAAGEPAMPSTPKRGAAARTRDPQDVGDTPDEEDDDAHYAALFKHGIYYSHLSFGDLKRIAEEAQQYALAEASGGRTLDDSDEDIGSAHDWSGSESDDDDEDDSDAPQPFTSYLHKSSTFRRRRNRRRDARAAAAQAMLAPTDTLQAALWSGNELKNHILSSTASGAASLEAGFAPSPSNSVDADVTRRGLAFAAEGNILAADASAAVPTIHSVGVHDGAAGPSNSTTHTPTQATSPTGAPSDKDRDESFLGVTSSLKQFGQAYQQATRRGSSGAASTSSPRWTPRGGSRLMSTGDSPVRRKRPDLGGASTLAPSSPIIPTSSSPLTLGGLAHKAGSLSVASRGAGAKSLLNNRYFSIPVDDTVRYGEFFAGLLSGATWGSGNANAGDGSVQSEHPSISRFEATGLAAFQDAHSLPAITSGSATTSNPSTKSTACLGDAPIFSRTDSFLVGGPFSDVKRSTDNLYGLRNKACKGRELGKLGSEVSHRKVALDGVLGSMGGARATSSTDSEMHHAHARGEEDEAQKSTPSASAPDKRASSLEEETLLDTGIALAKLEHRKWTGFEPMRIGVEYYGIDRLEEKQRLYSPSFFYAGSVWILYVQIMKKPKGMQLGVYLHRHGPFEPLPVRSAPLSEVLRFYKRESGEGEDDSTTGTDTTSFLPKDRSPTVPTHAAAAASASPRRVGTTASTSTSTTSVDAQLSSTTSALTLSPSSNGPPTLPGQSPPIPYRDPRKSVRAFFSIHCYSPLGNSLTRFDSGPDKFSESQSWGWKSSSLMGVWTLPTGKREEGKSERCEGFRCVVCLGVI